MSESTPGPWLVDPLKIGTPWNIGTSDGDTDIAIAAQLVGDGLQQTQRSANARLIAAAPELLAALKIARASFYKCMTVNGTNPEYAALACSRYDAAIAKAEGQ